MRIKVSRNLWITFVVLAVAVILVLQPQTTLAQEKFKLKFQATWPAGSTLYENFLMFAEQVKKMSGGRLEIETLPAGAVVPAFEVLDAVSRGVIDGGHSWASYWAGKSKAAVLFTGGPGGTFGMDFTDYLGWMFEGGGLELYNEFYQKELKLKVVPYPIMFAGPQSLGWFKKPIRNWDDFKGVKYRVGGMAGEVFSKAGASVVNIPGGEILPAGERGVIDAAEWVTPGEDMKMGLHEVWKNYYLPGMHESTTIAELIVNQDVWNKLPPDLQSIVEGACIYTFIRWQAKFNKYNSEALKTLREKHGVTISKTPEDILITFLKSWDKIAAEESAKNPFFKKTLESQRAFASIVVPARSFMFPPYSFAAEYYWGKQ
jgi:TRAP-type mannitol/chloroaromatic compound transport system substrate-binding protein